MTYETLINSFQTVGELGLKSKFLSSEYKRPLCIEIEDVKIKQTADDHDGGVEGDLEVCSRKSVTLEAKREISRKKSDGNDDDRYIKSVKDYSTQLLNYLLQFLPPTAMIILQVNIFSPSLESSLNVCNHHSLN